MFPATGTPPQEAEFLALLKPLLGRAHRVAYGLAQNAGDAEDLVRAHHRFSTFKPGSNFGAWFSRILLNCFREEYRRRKRRPILVQFEAHELGNARSRRAARPAAATDDPTALVIGRLELEEILGVMRTLPDPYRISLRLFLLESRTYAEIATMIRCPMGTVRSHIHRGRKLLRTRLARLVA